MYYLLQQKFILLFYPILRMTIYKSRYYTIPKALIYHVPADDLQSSRYYIIPKNLYPSTAPKIIYTQQILHYSKRVFAIRIYLHSVDITLFQKHRIGLKILHLHPVDIMLFQKSPAIIVGYFFIYNPVDITLFQKHFSCVKRVNHIYTQVDITLLQKS